MACSILTTRLFRTSKIALEWDHFLIADDHVIVRRGLRNLLHDRFQASISRRQPPARNSLKLANITPQPQLLVLDLQMTDGSALDRLERICTDRRACVFRSIPCAPSRSPNG